MKINNLKRREDYKKPFLRKSLLVDHINPKNYQNKINDILLKS